MSEASIPQPGVFSRRERLPRFGSAAFPGALAVFGVTGIAASSGGYFPTSWGWAALAFSWVAALAILLRAETDVGWLDLAFFGLLASFVGWIWLSALWSQSVPRSILEGERGLVALTGVGAAILVVARRLVPSLLGGVATAITLISAYALATRLFPAKITSFDPIAVYRLQEPLGYWNALGVFAAIGAMLCLAFAARGETLAARGAAGGTLAVLLPTIYFTFSRGSWLALGIGLVAALALDPRRLQLAAVVCVLGPVLALEVWLGSRESALTHRLSNVDVAAHQGHRYALVVVGVAAVTAALAVAFAFVERRVSVPNALRLVLAGLLALAVIAAIGGAIARYGSPSTIAKRAWHSFEAPPPVEGSNLNERLFSFSGNRRAEVWKSAWHDHDANPGLGSGAGTFQEWWFAHRTDDMQVVDAHSLYIEVLAELGPVGLALLSLALLVPIAAAILARGHPLVPVALGGYVAYLAHAGVDWDWEMTAVTLAALLVGVALVAAARRREPRAFGAVGRGICAGAAVAVGALAFVVLVGNLELSRAQDAAADRHWTRAAKDARSASDWAPWSSQALQTLAQAQGKLGRPSAQVATLRDAVRKDPHDSDLWYDLSAATSGAESNAAFVKSVRLDPYGFVANVRRAVLGKGSG
jgi:hypothetical protein